MTAPEHPGGPYFSELGDHLGAAYLRYSFTKGTQQEIGFLLELMALKAGDRILDVGCGPGRHAVALAQAGLAVTGVDVSQRLSWMGCIGPGGRGAIWRTSDSH